MKNIKYVALMLVCSLTMTSCVVKKVFNFEKKQKEPEVQRVGTQSDVFRTMTIDKATFNLTMAGTNMNSSGMIKIARDSVIICNITPLPGMEFFRFVINKKGVVLINRIDKKFVEVSFEEMKDKGIALNYQSFEAMFTNRIFLYGKDYFPFPTDFKVSELGNGSLQLIRNEENVIQEFSYDSNKDLVAGNLAIGSNYLSHWTYSNFFNVGSTKFPHDISLTIKYGVQSRTIGIHIDKVQLDKDRNFDVKIPATYKQITMKEFLQMY